MDLPPVSFNSTYQEHTFVAEVTRSFHPQVADLSSPSYSSNSAYPDQCDHYEE